jgi:hypothetical protein
MRPRPAAEVAVFPTGVPGRPYVEVAYLEVDAQTNDPEMLIDQLRQEAGDRGCDGVVLLEGNSATASGAWTTIRSTKRKGYRALCVVFRDPA